MEDVKVRNNSDVNLYTNETLKDLDRRIKRLEKQERKRKTKELEQALSQLRYMKMNEEEREAFSILEHYAFLGCTGKPKPYSER